MLKRLELSASQHQAWDFFCDERAVATAREKRFLTDCLLELGGKLSDAWQFDEATRTFWVNINDEARVAENLPEPTGAQGKSAD